MTRQHPEGPTTGQVVQPGLYVESPANRFVEAMEDARDDRRTEDLLVLAVRAIRHDPGCIEARLTLAEHSRDRETRQRHLGKAVETGELLWAPVAERLGDDMTWWGFSGTRPYMRAVAALGHAHLDDGNETEARACFDRLVAMNPNDNQGIRYLIEELDAEATMSVPGP